MSQQISAIGQIATEPKLYTSEKGVQFCTFRLASTERRYDTQRNEWIDGGTNWFTVNAFRTLAVHAKESFAKGDRIIVSGRLRIRTWEKEEKRGTSIEIDVDGVGHDVRWGVSSFTKKAARLEDPMPPAPEAEEGFPSTMEPPVESTAERRDESSAGQRNESSADRIAARLAAA